MLKQVVIGVGCVVFTLGGLFFAAGRPLSDLTGYFRAGASKTVESIENEIPDAVHDEKAATELAVARDQLVDRQVQLNLSENQLKNLGHEITVLEDAIADRGQVCASAYPVLQNAVDGGKAKVTFVSTKFSLEEFRHEIDDLLSMQERDETALRIKQAGYERLQQSVTDGASALAAMKNEMLEIEQEFAILKTRRDQARMEAETLDLVAGAASSAESSTVDIGKSIHRLQGHVEQLEARNAARRDVTPASDRVGAGRLTQSFNRLEALKKYATAESEAATDNDVAEASIEGPNQSGIDEQASQMSPFKANEVVIHIKGDKSKTSE